ncbi:Pectin lyase-like superfamily protein [Euphorbia peplus]|nr:Pectin lyase-like superfamily protein [Euphorbia peplus]
MFLLKIVKVLVCISIYIAVNNAQQPSNSFNVVDYGAVGDGNSDDSLAFLRTWNETCKLLSNSTIIIPKGKSFLLQPIIFSGPCNNYINMLLSGSIVAPNSVEEWKVSDISKWILFKDISGLNISGKGLIDGRGMPWWQRSCKINPTKGCLDLMPTSVVFKNCTHLGVSKIYMENSPQTHILVNGGVDVKLHFLHINAPRDSPNTDGIHLSASHGVSIHASLIGTGDDCISIGDQTSDIYITDIHCGPGHGISIGSLGRGGNEVNVRSISVKRVHFNGSTNGARIKTWQNGRGTVQDVNFSELTFIAVENPIIIDQHYGKQDIPQTSSGVHINNVSYSGAKGTSATKVAINLNCSSITPCTAITLDNIQLSSLSPENDIVSACSYAHGFTEETVTPTSCLVA